MSLISRCFMVCLRLRRNVDCGLSCDCVSSQLWVVSVGLPGLWWSLWADGGAWHQVSTGGEIQKWVYLLNSDRGFKKLYYTAVSYDLFISDPRGYQRKKLPLTKFKCSVLPCVTPDPVKSRYNPLNWNLTDDENQHMSSRAVNCWNWEKGKI